MTGVLRRLRSPVALLLAGVAVLLMVATLSAASDSAVEVGQGWVPGAGRRPVVQQDDAPQRNDDYETPPAVRAAAAIGLMLIMLVVFLVALFGLIAIVLGLEITWRRKEKRAGIGPLEGADEGGRLDVEVIRRAAGGALDRLREPSSGDPGDAVVAAWLALENAAADCGLARAPHQTPTEFTTTVLAGLRVDAAALDRLRGLYQRARFSTHRVVTDDDVAAARQALDRLVADLGAPAERSPA